MHALAFFLPRDVVYSILALLAPSYLPLQSLCALSTLSRQWLNFFSENQLTTFRSTAILRRYIQPGDSPTD